MGSPFFRFLDRGKYMKFQDAVDLILQFAGETPVSSPNEHPLQGVITRFLESTIAREQLMDWWFNVELNVTFPQDSLGKVPVSSAVKKAVFDSPDLILRGLSVYDRQNQTFLIHSDVTAIQITRQLEWVELPELMQQWVMFQAAKYYILGTIGDSGLTAELKQEGGRSFIMLKTQDIKEKNINVFNTPSIARMRSGRLPYGGR